MVIKTKEDVIKRLCKLSTLVMEKQFKFQNPADCICITSNNSTFEFSDDILEFIEQAVQDKLNVVPESEPLTKTFFYRITRHGAVQSGVYEYTYTEYDGRVAYLSLVDYLNIQFGVGQYSLTGFNPL